MVHTQILLALFALTVGHFSFAQNNQFRITYGSSSWNRESDKIDQAYMFLREKKSGKVAKILIEETEPDSSIFSGPFSIDWKTAESSDIEAFVIEEANRYNEKSLSSITTQIQNGKIKPSPLFIRAQEKVKLVEVYDTQAQALRAKQLYENQLKQSELAARTDKLKPVPSKQDLAVAELTEKAALLKKLASEAAEREAMRLRLEQLEEQRLAQLKKQQDEMSTAEKNKRIAEAESWAAKGTTAYQAGDYKNSEAAFSKSLELNPNSRSYHFMYGVSLYRNEKLNEALVAFKLSPPNAKTDNEKAYYQALIHYRLKEINQAKAMFTQVQKSGDKVLAPSAAFYNGIILMGEEKFDPAKAAFEWVLDNSQDPALDKKAEEFIEQIAGMIEAKKIAAQKWDVKATFGATYDSNILYAPDGESSQGSATDKGGLRASIGGDVDYRIFYKMESELNAKVSTTYMYSLDDQFAKADPFVISAALPYTRKGTMSKKGYKLELSPGYETIYMDANDTGTRDQILNSVIGASDLTLIMRPDWFAGYSFEVRKEDSLLESNEDDNLDATKFALKTQHIFLLDKSKKRALVALGGLTVADAKGINKKFNRLDAGVIYTAPTKKWKNTSLTLGLTAYTLDYNKSTDDRKDNNFSLLAGTTRVLNPKWSWGLNATYTSNASSVDDYQYSKYTLMNTFTYNWVK